MTKIVFLILTMLLGADDWVIASQEPNYKLYYSEELKTSKWLGYPDSNYAWDGERLSYERIVKDEDGKDVTVKTYKDPIEIIADFKPESKVFGVEGNIERNAVKKFGGALKGFVWLDNVSGGGEVILPFTAPHIFIARGDRLNPDLAEIGIDPNADNYYEVIEGKTHIFVKSFSGIGGAAGAPPTLIAHYKFNENTSGDNAESVTNSNFSAWTDDNPDGWTVVGESGSDPEISEVGTGEGHGGVGTGMCNLFTSDTTFVAIRRVITIVVGRKYRLSINVDTVNAGSLSISELNHSMWDTQIIDSIGVYTWTFVATFTNVRMEIKRNIGSADITFDDVSLKLLAVEDSSGNDHDGLAQQDTSAISVVGKINTAFDFTSPDHIEIPDHDDFTPALTPFSISAWVNMRNSRNFKIASKGILNTEGEWLLQVSGTSLIEMFLFDESVTSCYIARVYNTSMAAYENQWIHLVATYDGGTLVSGIRIYLNGIRVDDTDKTSNPGSFEAVENLNHAIWIGKYDNAYADGLIDEVVFFSVELTADEVNILFNNNSGTEIIRELDSQISPRRSNLSPLPLRRRYEF